MNAGNWLENIGDIMPSSKDEILWIVPEVFTYDTLCCVTSPWFDFDQRRWRLCLMPSDGHWRDLHGNNEWLALFLWTKELSTPNQEYQVKLGVRSADGVELYSCSGVSFSEYGFGKWNFVTQSSVGADSSMNGRLKIFCVIERKECVPGDILSSTSDEDSNKSDVDEENQEQKKILKIKGVDRLVENLKDLLRDEHKGDVVLKVEKREFRVHKDILAARSSVFASMFQHEMIEKDSEEVDIPDCTPESFDLFLLYIYTGTVSNMSSGTVYNLYYAADKYHVEDLKEECVEYMMANLSVDNFCDTIALSLQHSEFKLHKEAVCFFSKNIKKIIKTVQWQKYLKENSTHANELLIKALNA